MKRSRTIRLVLIGGLAAGASTGCGPAPDSPAAVASANVYTNDHHVAGLGYYHAPFRAWYPEPYNRFDPQTGRYYAGGEWRTAPYASITNLSSPNSEAVMAAQALQPARTGSTFIRRGGFGSSSISRTFVS